MLIETQTPDRFIEKPLLIQFLTIHFTFDRDKPELLTAAQLKTYINSASQFVRLLPSWEERGKMIVYLEFFGLATWNPVCLKHRWRLVDNTCTRRQPAFRQRRTLCAFNYLEKAKMAHPDDLGIRLLGDNLALKLQTDKALCEVVTAVSLRYLLTQRLNICCPVSLRGA